MLLSLSSGLKGFSAIHREISHDTQSPPTEGPPWWALPTLLTNFRGLPSPLQKPNTGTLDASLLTATMIMTLPFLLPHQVIIYLVS